MPLQVLGVILALTCFLKGKKFTGIVGLFIPAVALVGAIRLAKPGSRWARRYEDGKLGALAFAYPAEPAGAGRKRPAEADSRRLSIGGP